MGGRGSGGHNALAIVEHLKQGTYRPGRHGQRLLEETREATPLSAADRRRTLAGLGPEARRIASRLLDDYQDWSVASLHSLRRYAQSCERLEQITDDDERRRELRINVVLLKALELEK